MALILMLLSDISLGTGVGAIINKYYIHAFRPTHTISGWIGSNYSHNIISD